MLRDLIIVLGVFVAVVVVSRRFWWWYWGLDRAIDALEDIAASLRALPAVADHDRRTRRPPARAA
jgi:hypothetical protein